MELLKVGILATIFDWAKLQPISKQHKMHLKHTFIVEEYSIGKHILSGYVEVVSQWVYHTVEPSGHQVHYRPSRVEQTNQLPASTTVRLIHQYQHDKRAYSIPGVRISLGFFSFFIASTCSRDGFMRPSRALSASWNVTDPPIALRVLGKNKMNSKDEQ